MSHPTAETISMLEANGWTVECESPFEIRHGETGSFATMLAAQAVADELRSSLAGELDEARTRSMDQGEAFAELAALSDRSARHIATAASVGGEASPKGADAWETAYDLVFSDQLSGRVSQLLAKLNHRLDYCDPDTTYEEDVTAYATALARLVERMRPFFA